MAELVVRCGSEGDAKEDEGLPFWPAEEDGDSVRRYGVVERKRWK